MLEMIVYGLIWCFAIYGILVMLQEITRKSTYQKVEENVKLIMMVKNVEDGIENYVRELKMGNNFYNNLVIIDLDSQDDTLCILRELEKENINLKILDKQNGKLYLENQIK
ncbi:MAG: hypothetical protein IKL55_06820 [Clostridia bacterium]|nr:hypothetical protein [Clostridia bacterium]